MDAQQIIAILGLKPHHEGGYFTETYKSREILSPESLPGGFSGPRLISTAIYYLLTQDTFSEIHRLPGVEIFHFYMGDPVEMLQLWPDGNGRVITMGTDLAAGMRPQVVVPGNVWQGTRIIGGGSFTLLGTTMAPGFDYQDYELGKRSDLVPNYPGFESMIRALTRE